VRKLSLCLLLLLTLPIASHAQTFPGTTLRIIVTNPPGVPNDTLARGLLEPLSKAFGQPVLIDNRVGADGIVGAEACARAAPDGHTICSTTGGVLTVNSVVRQKIPFDPIRDFTGVAFAGFFDSLLVVHPSVPAKSVQDLLALARTKPDSIPWGHFGLSTSGNFYPQWLRTSRDVRFLIVPYKTVPQVLQASLAGEIHAMIFGWPQLLPLLKAGKLRALATTSDKRLPFLPDVPSLEEEGMKLPLRGWFAYHAPAATPRAAVNRWNAEIRKISAEPSYREKFLAPLGMPPNDWSPEAVDAFVRENLREMTQLVKSIGLKPE
jgi:tripartite-type tricarboxylate transporter receptor subunit TctC